MEEKSKTIGNALVTVRGEEEKKKMEEFIYRKTGVKKTIRLDYSGEVALVVLTNGIEIKYNINVTCAIYWPYARLRSVDKYIEWYENLEKNGLLK